MIIHEKNRTNGWSRMISTLNGEEGHDETVGTMGWAPEYRIFP